MKEQQSKKSSAKYEDELSGEATASAVALCKDGASISIGIDSVESVASLGSTILFLAPSDSLSPKSGKAFFFVPTQHLLDILDVARQIFSNEKSLELFRSLSTHSLTKAPAGWLHETLMHKRLVNRPRGNLSIR